MRKCLRAHLNGILEDIIDVYGDWKPILQLSSSYLVGLNVNNAKLILLYRIFLVPLHHK